MPTTILGLSSCQDQPLAAWQAKPRLSMRLIGARSTRPPRSPPPTHLGVCPSGAGHRRPSPSGRRVGSGSGSGRRMGRARHGRASRSSACTRRSRRARRRSSGRRPSRRSAAPPCTHGRGSASWTRRRPLSRTTARGRRRGAPSATCWRARRQRRRRGSRRRRRCWSRAARPKATGPARSPAPTTSRGTASPGGSARCWSRLRPSRRSPSIR